MCYDDNAIPPTPPGSAGAARGEDLVLMAPSDGNRFYAYFAFPEQPSNAQILIYPDVRGLHKFYKELALRFA
jgi:carboxymethylenebutenolidase